MARTSPPSGPDWDQPPGRESRGRTPAVLDLPAIAAVIIPLLTVRSALRVQLAKMHNMLLDARCQREADGIGRMARQVWGRALLPPGDPGVSPARRPHERKRGRRPRGRVSRANKRRSQAVLRLCPTGDGAQIVSRTTSGKLDIAASAVHRGSIRRIDHA